jgi:hypothetical protein
LKIYHRQIQTATSAPARDLKALESIMRELSSGTLDHLSEQAFARLARKALRIFNESKDLYGTRQLHSVVFFELKSSEQELAFARRQGATAKAAELEAEIQNLAKKEEKLRNKLLSLAA